MSTELSERKACACGCGGLTSGKNDPRRPNRFIKGHYSPMGDTARAAKISTSLKGHECSDETRRKLSIAHTGKVPRILIRGYAMIYVPDHPHANSSGRVMEHRLVIERILGRYLDPSEHIHHIDFSRSNNRASNLKIVTNAEHQRIHRAEEKRRRDGSR
jgi:hypothetical protein